MHLQYANEIAPLVERIREAPALRYFEPLRRERRQRAGATYGDWLGDNGFFSADLVLQQMLAWKDIFEEEDPTLVLGEQSPVAMLTARAMGIACAAIGTGLTLPPPELPSYPPWLSDITEPLWSEPQMIDAVNAALAAFGNLRLQSLPQVYDCDAQFACTPALFDPHHDARKTPTLPPNLPRLDIPERLGDEVFIYLSTWDRHDPIILAAVASLRLPKRMFAPGLEPSLNQPLRDHGIIIEEAAVPPRLIAARSRVALHAGNHGTASLCLRTGLPFVAIPQQREQMFNASRAESAGLGRMIRKHEVTVPDIHKAIYEIYESEEAPHRATELAHHVAPEFANDPVDLIAERIGALFH